MNRLLTGPGDLSGLAGGQWKRRSDSEGGRLGWELYCRQYSEQTLLNREKFQKSYRQTCTGECWWARFEYVLCRSEVGGSLFADGSCLPMDAVSHSSQSMDNKNFIGALPIVLYQFINKTTKWSSYYLQTEPCLCQISSPSSYTCKLEIYTILWSSCNITTTLIFRKLHPTGEFHEIKVGGDLKKFRLPDILCCVHIIGVVPFAYLAVTRRVQARRRQCWSWSKSCLNSWSKFTEHIIPCVHKTIILDPLSSP